MRVGRRRARRSPTYGCWPIRSLLHGPVASTATAWRVLKSIDPARLAALRAARAVARERAWLARGELTGTAVPPARAGGRDLSELVIDVDATLVEVHSDKQGASGHFKGGYGYHPLLAFLDNTNEALAGILRTGRAGSNTAADHIELLDLAVAQIPDAWRGKPILVRSDGAGFSHALIAHLAAQGWGYSVGWPVTETVRTAIATLVRRSWTPAIEADGSIRDGADVAELTGLLDLSGWPPGMRIIVRRERPHPGAQLDAFEHRDGYRYQTFATNTPHGGGPIAFPGGPSPRPRPCRGPHPLRQRQWPGPAALSGTGHQRRLAGTRPRRRRPHRLAADHASWPGNRIWPGPSRKRCATGCCTPPPGSPAAAGGSSSTSPAPGPGPPPSSTRSPGSGSCPSRPEHP